MRPRVVILGGGFAGLRAAQGLRRAAADVTLIDRTNHHLFQPLLYQVATAVLAPSDITSPIRYLLRDQQNTTVLLGDVTGVDVARRMVALDGGAADVPYDYLVVATGSRHAYFGHDDWELLAPGLKSMDDAREMRRRFLLAFEIAERTDDLTRRAACLTFVIVGGGPTGVELAGSLPDVARAIRRDFRHADTTKTRVLLLEGGPRVLPAFPEPLSRRAARDLEHIGVEVRTNSFVTRIEPDAVYVGAERIPACTVFWAAGNAGSPLARSLGVPLDSAGRVRVEPDLSVPGHPEIFVAGDLAAFPMPDGELVPGVAPAANQEGALAARNIIHAMRGEPRQRFHYRDKGNLATIGRHRAIAVFGRVRLTGYLAWWFWLFVHILYLAGFRNRLSVLVEWGYAYIAYQRGSRLLTDDDRERTAAEDPAFRPKKIRASEGESVR